MPELYKVHNRIRSEVNELAKTNNQLTLSVSNLTQHVSNLKRTENSLHIHAIHEEIQVDALRRLIQQNKLILEEKEQLIRENLIAKLMYCVLEGESETDVGDTFDSKEIKRMLLYMQSLKPLVVINEPLLRKTIQTNNSTTLSIIKLINDLNRKGIQHGDRIFQFQSIDHHEEELWNRMNV